MNQFSNHVNKEYKRDSFDENIHSIINGGLSSFVDDIPFEFNPKYRTIIVVSHLFIKNSFRNQYKSFYS